MRKSALGILARYILAAAPLAPAMAINPDWLGHTALGWKLAAAGGILCAAVFIEGARHVRPWFVALVVFAVGLFGCYVNVLVAMKNATHASEDSAHARRAANLAAKTASSQSSQRSQRRSALVDLAGETPSATYEAQIQSKINSNIGKWNSTEQCTDVSAKASGAFCAEVATLRGKKKAAEDREKMDAEAPPDAPKAETVEDPFADAFPKFAAAFGITVTKDNATAHLNGVQSIWLELMAAFGPMTILAILDGIALAGAARAHPPLEPTPAKEAPSAPARPEPIASEMPAEPVPAMADLRAKEKAAKAAELQRRHDAFVADELEEWNGVWMKTGDLWKMWQKRCARKGDDPGGQREFSQRLANNFTHDHNNGRPRFLNVRAKAQQGLRVVGGKERIG